MISAECVIFLSEIILTILKNLSRVVEKTDIFGADPRKMYF